MIPMKKLFSLLFIFTLLLGVLALPATAATASTEGFAAQVLALVNEERAKQNLPALRGGNSALTAAAQLRAQEIQTSFSHTRPNGTQCFSVLGQYNVGAYSQAGENIAYGQATPDEVMQAWMNSSGHRANILGNYTQLGVGVYEVNGTVYWSQEFINDNPPSRSSASGASSSSAHFWDSWSTFGQWCLKWLLLGWLWEQWA